MDFVSIIIRMFIRDERTGNFELHISSLEKMLPYLAAANNTVIIQKYFQVIKNLCPCLEKKYKEGSFTIRIIHLLHTQVV